MPSSNDYNFRLLKIDDLTRNEHCWLEENDYCYYFTEYFSRQGYSYSRTNQLIFNFKAPIDKETRKYYKNLAIESIANLIRSHFTNINTEENSIDNKLVFIPIPPSKTLDHPLYDDRLIQVLKRVLIDSLIKTDILIQTTSTDAAHESETRPSLEEQRSLFQVNTQSLNGNIPEAIFIFDDILTTGCHFKAAKLALQEVFPNIAIIGLFIARVVRLAEEIETF